MSGYGTPAQGRGPLGRELVAKRGGRTRAEFANEIGVSEFTLAGWEQGIHRPTRLAFETLRTRSIVPLTLEWSAIDAYVKKAQKKIKAKKAAREAVKKMKASHRETVSS